MGYANYDLDDGKGPRGYAVETKCEHPGCDKSIDRGLAFLCYGCTGYFCNEHQTCAWVTAADEDEDIVEDVIEFECFAGKSSQCCKKCATEAEAGNGAIV